MAKCFVNLFHISLVFGVLDNLLMLGQSPPEVHTRAAEILCAITRNMSSPLAIKLSSLRFVLREIIILVVYLFDKCSSELFLWQLC